MNFKNMTTRSLAGAATGLAALALALSGCSSSVAPQDEPTAAAPTATAEATTAAPTASESAAPTQAAAAGDVESLQREGSPADWKDASIAGASKRALVPQAQASAGGSIVFKGTEGLQEFSFSAATPDGVERTSPLMVKVITADEGKPTMVTLAPGSTETVTVPVNGSQIVKIVWNTKGKPAQGENIAFFDFNVK
ncbi:MAG: hypothetical protein Q4P06_08955 [Actinomycetaceae bacterium]|nr:hypothetical protein [Actinomycetaceae bacterium]